MAKNNFIEADESAIDGSHLEPHEALTEAGTLVRVRAGETDEEIRQEMYRLGLLGVACLYMPTQEIADRLKQNIAWHAAVHKAGVNALQARENRRLRRLDRIAEAA